MLEKNKKLQEVKDFFLKFLATKFGIEKFSKKIQDWHTLSSGEFLKELGKIFKQSNVHSGKGLKPIVQDTDSLNKGLQSLDKNPCKSAQ